MIRLPRRTLLGIAGAGVWRGLGGLAAAEAPPVAAPSPSPPAAGPDPYADAVLVDGVPPPPQPDAFTFVVLPDTQHYSEKFPELFTAQTEWIAANRHRHRIAAVFHLGDITNHSKPCEWENARRSLGVLDATGLPVCLVPGNHDYSEGGRAVDRTTRLNEYFPLVGLTSRNARSGAYDREPDRRENTFQVIEAGGRKFLAVGLEFAPRADVVRWANEVIGDHRDHEVILVTHAFVYHDDTRLDWARFGEAQKGTPYAYGIAKASGNDVSDGEDLWRKLVSRHDNVVLVMSGHIGGDGLGRLSTPTGQGREIPQFLANFQFRPRGGDGWLRLLELRSDGTAHVLDYSPTRGQLNTSPQNRFELRLSRA